MPETYTKCDTVYTVNRDNTRLLRCALYKQGYHESCLSENIKMSLAAINSNISGNFIWLCPGCDKHLCSSSTVVGRKKTPPIAQIPPIPNVQEEEPADDTHQHGPSDTHHLTAPPPPPQPPLSLLRNTETGTAEVIQEELQVVQEMKLFRQLQL